jgi:branched-chain amino acid transport system substrate-binding protein
MYKQGLVTDVFCSTWEFEQSEQMWSFPEGGDSRTKTKEDQMCIRSAMSWVLVCVIIGLALGGCGPTPVPTPVPSPTVAAPTAPPAAPSEPVKIGVPFPLSGALAAPGADSKAAVELAVDIINESHDLDLPLARTQGLPSLGGAPVEAIFADHAMDPEKALRETERLITEEGVVAINGAWASSTTATASQAAERMGIPFLNANSTSPALGERGFQWYFRTTPHDRVFVRNMFEFMHDMEEGKDVTIETIAILHEDTMYGTDSADTAKKLAEEYGYEIVADIAYPQNATDCTSEIQRLKAAKPDVLIQADYTSNAILAVMTYKDLDFNVDAIIANDVGFIDLQYIEAVGENGNYIFSRDLWSKDWVEEHPLVSTINTMYKERAGKDLTGTSARAFTGFLVLADVINRAGSTEPEAIRQALLDTDMPPEQLIMPWAGIRFDPETHENVLGRGIVVQMQDGEYYTVWPFDRAARDPIWPMPKWSER